MMMGKPIKVKGAKRLRNKEVIPFTRQLASMLGAGMTILASIQTLGEQCADQEFKKVLQHLSEVIESGAPMSNGLADFPQLFDEMYVNMVIAGEQSRPGPLRGPHDLRARRLPQMPRIRLQGPWRVHGGVADHAEDPRPHRARRRRGKA